MTRAILETTISIGAEEVRVTRVNICGIGIGHRQTTFPLEINIFAVCYVEGWSNARQ